MSGHAGIGWNATMKAVRKAVIERSPNWVRHRGFGGDVYVRAANWPERSPVMFANRAMRDRWLNTWYCRQPAKGKGRFNPPLPERRAGVRA